ncbi:hypothetical protein ColLi_07126 [Colletotrichum liriopes]|uniref:Uncharacterized protein n=1 Tax=Colletotrichum liriopes TaxID=708192 RepID=A0AA37GNH3_9PEZI|nr:hypothetical protein ColLi_07126 [Colletotrichum liriopes]
MSLTANTRSGKLKDELPEESNERVHEMNAMNVNEIMRQMDVETTNKAASREACWAAWIHTGRTWSVIG